MELIVAVAVAVTAVRVPTRRRPVTKNSGSRLSVTGTAGTAFGELLFHRFDCIVGLEDIIKIKDRSLEPGCKNCSIRGDNQVHALSSKPFSEFCKEFQNPYTKFSVQSVVLDLNRVVRVQISDLRVQISDLIDRRFRWSLSQITLRAALPARD
jgi:hypothetical protein